MTYDDINFYINDRRRDMRVFGGEQSGSDFFERLKEHLTGKCTVEFRVGDQTVNNDVVLNGLEYRVANNFVPRDIEVFIAREKDRIKKEQEDACFADTPLDVFFVPAELLLTCKQTLPAFDRTKLAKDPQGPRFFVSHRWQSASHPDPAGRHLALLKEHAAAHLGAFYWIDFSCLPQSRDSADAELFSKTLPKIASIQAKSSTIVIMEPDYDERLWCYIEHFAGVLFAQTNLNSGGRARREIEYLGGGTIDRSILDRVQTLQEPEWEKFRVTKLSDIPGIRYNYRWLSNLVRFQLYDRFSELRRSLPGHDVYSGRHYFQSAFGLDYTGSLGRLRPLFTEFGGDVESFYKEGSLLWLAERFSWSVFPDDYKIEEFQFSPALFFSEDMVGWIALHLGILKVANRGNDKMMNLREHYARIVLMSLFK